MYIYIEGEPLPSIFKICKINTEMQTKNSKMLPKKLLVGVPPSPEPYFSIFWVSVRCRASAPPTTGAGAIFFPLSPEEFYFPPTGENRNCQMGGFGGKVAHFFFAWKLPNGNLEGKYFFFFFDQPHLGNLDNFIVAKMKKR